MNGLTQEQLESLRRRLEDERVRLSSQIDGVVVREEADVETQDAAANEDGRQQEIRLAKRNQQRLVEVEAALRRVVEGTYGLCEETDEEIPYARLEFDPTARYTVDAAESLAEDDTAGDGSRDDPGAY